MKKVLFIFLMLFMPFTVSATQLVSEWQKNWGGSDYDALLDAIETQDGGIIAVGFSRSTDINGFENVGDIDGIILKYNNQGELQWQTSWGGNKREDFYALSEAPNGDIYVVGTSSSTDINDMTNNGNSDAILLKYNKEGELQWQKNYGGNKSDSLNEITFLSNNELLLVGTTSSTNIDGITNNGSSDILLIKSDLEGNILWKETWGGNQLDNIEKVIKTSDGGYALAGSTSSTNIEGINNEGSPVAILLKYTNDGELSWVAQWGTPTLGYHDRFYDIKEVDDGYVLVGSTNTLDDDFVIIGGQNALIIKFDKQGKVLWKKNWGGESEDGFKGIEILDDGTYLVNAYSSSKQFKYKEDEMQFIDQLKINVQDIVLIKYDKNGKIIWQTNWGGNKGESASKMILKNDKIFLIGTTTSTDLEGIIAKGGVDALVVGAKLDYNIVIQENLKYGNVSAIQKDTTGVITPTPDKGYEVDKVIVKDSRGNEIKTTKLQDGTYTFELYDDVTIETIFKEILENPKTGEMNYGLLYESILILSVFGLIFLILYKSNSTL